MQNWFLVVIGDKSDIGEEIEYHDDTCNYYDKETEVEETGVNDIVSEDVDNCECGKGSSKELFKCKDCRKYFCKDCPSAPLEDHQQCLQYTFNDVMMTTSPPQKTQRSN